MRRHMERRSLGEFIERVARLSNVENAFLERKLHPTRIIVKIKDQALRLKYVCLFSRTICDEKLIIKENRTVLMPRRKTLDGEFSSVLQYQYKFDCKSHPPF